jgi:hypothetical protein
LTNPTGQAANNFVLGANVSFLPRTNQPQSSIDSLGQPQESASQDRVASLESLLPKSPHATNSNTSATDPNSDSEFPNPTVTANNFHLEINLSSHTRIN